MFTRAFATQTLAPTAQGNPAPIAGSITWAAGLVADHPVATNAVFATAQLLLALGFFWRPTVKTALAASLVWGTVALSDRPTRAGLTCPPRSPTAGLGCPICHGCGACIAV
jgi:hypothetical protein